MGVGVLGSNTPPGAVLNVYAFGTDGAVDMDGVNVYSFAALAGSTYTLNRDIAANTLRVRAGITLNPNGFRVFVKDTLTNAGTITRAGANGVGQSAGGSGATFAALGGGTDSGQGSAGGNGTNGVNTVNPMAGGVGGAGGASGGGANGGAGGATTSVANDRTANYGNLVTMLLGYTSAHNTGDAPTWKQPAGGTGGGGGGCTSGGVTGSGGRGGGGGGWLLLVARRVINSGTITAKGGDGAAGQLIGGTTGAGGGGGGGGGVCAIIYEELTDTGTITAAGGTGGAGAGTGLAGANGGAGALFTLSSLA